ncbi:MAG TPA: hypothetical protein VGS79_17985 [Puia sp.]|nr:hypothetical protein [Puia sp.]
MLDNEFDQIFRDRLLDHPSKVRQGLWKQVHTHLVRYNAFWKWYFVGPSAVAVAVTGYFLVAAIRSSSSAKHPSPTAAVATYNVHPNPDSSALAGSSTPGSSTPRSSAGSAQSSSAAASPAPAQATTPGAKVTSPATSAPTSSTPTATAGPVAASPAALGPATASATSNSTPAGTTVRTTPHPSPAAHRNRRRPGSSAGRPANDATATSTVATGSDASRPTSTGSGANRLTNTSPGTNKPANATHPPIPAQLTASAKLATLKIRGDIAAATTNPKKPQQLILPARRPRKLPPVRVDAFGSPEYFASNIFGFSYGAGARVTIVFKNHWTFTSGIQYERIAVTGNPKDSSLGYLPPGTIKNIHLPLLLGYATGNDRFTFSANAGVLLTLRSFAAGEMTHGNGVWPNRNGLIPYLGLNFSSRVTSKVSIFAEPYVKRWRPPYNHYQPYTESFPSHVWSTGLMVGIRYNF